MRFNVYEKMENDFSRLTKEMEKAQWVVTEKIHGANFSFHVEHDEVKVARRRGFLEENENFFNHLDAKFMKSHPEKMKAVYEHVVKQYPDKEITQLTVWGELFGGLYVVNGKNLSPSECKPVQLEVQYTPEIEWVAFDISYRTKENPEKHDYLDYDVAMEIFTANDIFHLKPLFTGPMNEALNYDLKFDSTIPKIYGLPALPKGSNIVEGVVAKPVKTLKYENNLKKKPRAVVKLKNGAFTEVVLQTPKAHKLRSKLMAYATDPRLHNAISKHGSPDNEEVNKRIVDEFLEDIFVDVKKDDATLYAEWESTAESKKAKIKNSVVAKANILIKKFNNSR